MTLLLMNVAIPITLDDRFIAPDLEEALKYYPEFVKYSGLDLSPQEYILLIMKEIDRRHPNGYTGDVALSELINHTGFIRLAELWGIPVFTEERSAFARRNWADFFAVFYSPSHQPIETWRCGCGYDMPVGMQTCIKCGSQKIEG